MILTNSCTKDGPTGPAKANGTTDLGWPNGQKEPAKANSETGLALTNGQKRPALRVSTNATKWYSSTSSFNKPWGAAGTTGNANMILDSLTIYTVDWIATRVTYLKS